jgi:glycosyltransferase involved in cell wall biosynthesis
MTGTNRPKNKKNIFQNYLERQQLAVPGFTFPPAAQTGFIVVVPSYNEPGLLQTIRSLQQCTPPSKPVEAIIVVNSHEGATGAALNQNNASLAEMAKWQQENSSHWLSVYPIHIANIPKKVAGVGYARKKGMDLAIQRFAGLGNEDGAIISLDADTTCATNYFVQIEAFFKAQPKATGCNIHFEHDLENTESLKQKMAIAQYELYLRYFKECLASIGFPYAFHTIGSAFALKAREYCLQGGMNPRQAGEDFYFLQKLFYPGQFYELNSTCVYPSARESDRVVFGTGASVNNLMAGENPLEVYSPESFQWVRSFYEKALKYFSNPEVLRHWMDNSPEGAIAYLHEFKALDKLEGLQQNVSGLPLFEKRLCTIFNNFFIIKWLNQMHQGFIGKVGVRQAAGEFLIHAGLNANPMDVIEMLGQYRKIQKSRPVILQQ